MHTGSPPKKIQFWTKEIRNRKVVSQKKLKTVQMEHDCDVVPDDDQAVFLSIYLTFVV